MGSNEQRELKELAEMGCQILGLEIRGSLNGLPTIKSDYPYEVHEETFIPFDPEDLNRAWQVFFAARDLVRSEMLSGRMMMLYNAFHTLYGYATPREAALVLMKAVRAALKDKETEVKDENG